MSARVLIVGAGVAGQVAAYELARAGAEVTVLEQAATLRRTGGHAVDLADVATDIIERMGLLDAVTAARVDRDLLVFREGASRRLEMSRVSAAISARHIEIQREDLCEILYAGNRAAVEYRFGDTVTELAEHADGVDVTFREGRSERYDIVIGADGLHSVVRRLVFGPEAQFRHDLGAALSVFSYPNPGIPDRQVHAVADVDLSGFVYPVDDGTQARALLLFRTAGEPPIHYRDRAGQLARAVAAVELLSDRLPITAAAAEGADDFYYDSIAQIRMDSWSSARVALVGDAGYSPGPAVGGGNAVAVLGGYVLASQLAHHSFDSAHAFSATEQVMAPIVSQARKVAPSTLRQLVPTGRLGAWLLPRALRALTSLPAGLTQKLAALGAKRGRTLADYDPEA
ncbi:FAD-dependent monooxygenase [Ruania zhangjianzhongii]|uniref:FAD-dependent monooxygenase n=1 Tax=Ruania zhangjianzhongii TaxID=2603206 RepID=UPI0011CC2343|nr:FAD-dependent monooxygenase [Ruania zhangjianzhongii]